MSAGEEAVWRGMSRPDLDRAYNSALAVPDLPEIVAGWERRSAALREKMPEHLDLRYGDRPRNRLDFFSAGAGAATLLFLHGGWWQSRSKEMFSFVAQGPLSCGVSVAVAGYTLAPEATLDEIVAETRAVLAFMGRELRSLGGDPDRLFVSGWSAGGHLTAMTLTDPCVRGGLAISGLYDLEPIRCSYVNDKLRLDAEAARRNSPVLHLPRASPPLCVAVGASELPEMRRQSAEYAAARRARGLPVALVEVPGANHFTVVEELAAPEGVLTRLVRQMVFGEPP